MNPKRRSISSDIRVNVGPYLAALREERGLTQAQLARNVTFSTATLSRIESGDKDGTEEEVLSLLRAIGTPKAAEFEEFLRQDWDHIPRPPFSHPNRAALWQGNLALRIVSDLRRDLDLKAVFLNQVELYEGEIRRLVDLLRTTEHQIACIGNIGVGKSTAICKLIGLLKPGEERLDRQIVLETGAGGITLCEVQVSQGPRYGIRIVPRTENSIRRDVEDFCEYLMSVTNATPGHEQQGPPDGEETDSLGISKEVVRAIRNMAGLTEKRREESGRRVRIDPAKDLARQFKSKEELCVEILTRMDLLRRNRRDVWYPADESKPAENWLQDLFAAINNGRHPEFTLPQKIEVIVPFAVLGSKDLTLRIVDTKGIDQTAERQDLECHFDDPKTLVVLCTRFNEAPDVSVQTLLRRAKDGRARDLTRKTVILVLPRPSEAMIVKYDDGAAVETDDEGYALKKDQIQLRLDQAGISNIPIDFFNAREEKAVALQNGLLQQILDHRNYFAQQLVRLHEAVDQLSANRKNEEIRLVFEHVMSDITSWIKQHESFEASSNGVEKPLLEAIGGMRYASTIRAAVRRYGDWYNLDYYHHLGYGLRRLAVEQIGRRVSALKVIIDNLRQNDELAAAKKFLEGLSGRVEVLVDEVYRRMQAAGRETFKQTLAKQSDFWTQCEGRWGKGAGYRNDIRNMTSDELHEEAAELEKLLRGLINFEWKRIINATQALLDETGTVEPMAAASE